MASSTEEMKVYDYYEVVTRDPNFVGAQAEITSPVEIFDRMLEIIDHEQLSKGNYLEDWVDKELAESGAVCQGHKACAIGALFLAGGVPVVPTKINEYSFGITYVCPGSFPDPRRKRFLALPENRGLFSAHAYLERAAQEYVDKHDLCWDDEDPEDDEDRLLASAHRHGSLIEAVFEGDYPEDPNELMRPIVERARQFALGQS